jgi:acyl-CoA thioester hydrolase
MSDQRRYQIQMKVPFHDLDPMQVVWHGNYLKYFDIVRFGLFSDAGIDLHRYSMENNYIFPVTKTFIKYIVPLRYGDEFICKAILIDASIKIDMNFEIERVKDKVICTKAKSDQVAVKMPEMEMMFEIPKDIRVPLGF